MPYLLTMIVYLMVGIYFQSTKLIGIFQLFEGENFTNHQEQLCSVKRFIEHFKGKISTNSTDELIHKNFPLEKSHYML